MRVLFLVSGYPSEARPSLGIFHRTLAEALSRAGAQVEVAAPVPFVPPGFMHLTGRWKQYASVPYRYSMNGVEVYSPRYVQILRGDVLAFPHRMMEKAVRSCIKDPPDIIHAHYAYPLGLAALGLSKRWGIPYVLTLHGSDVHTNPHVNRRAMKRFRRAVDAAACVTTVSRALADQAEAMSGRRPETIPIGLRLDVYDAVPEKQAARASLGLPAGERLVLFIGALVREKGLKEFMDALGMMHGEGVRGVVVGEGPMMKEAASHPSLLCMGSVANEQVPLVMKACDMIVLPSHREGMPTVLVEAGAAGLPIAASRAGGIPELLADGRGLLLDEISAGAVRAAIGSVMRDEAGAGDRSRRMRAYIEAQYDARKNAEIYMERYRACVHAART